MFIVSLGSEVIKDKIFNGLIWQFWYCIVYPKIKRDMKY